MQDLLIFIGLIVVLFIAWFMNEGYRDTERTEDKFIKPAAPLDSGETYDEKLFDFRRFFTPNRGNETTQSPQ